MAFIHFRNSSLAYGSLSYRPSLLVHVREVAVCVNREYIIHQPDCLAESPGLLNQSVKGGNVARKTPQPVVYGLSQSGSSKIWNVPICYGLVNKD